MDYSLALELKNAGYPQDWKKVSIFYDKEGTIWTVGDCETLVEWKDNPDGNEYTYAPTLDELVETCGVLLHGMEKVLHYSVDDVDMGDGWLALPYPLDYAKGVFGSTPKIAVANLWLALNKK